MNKQYYNSELDYLNKHGHFREGFDNISKDIIEVLTGIEHYQRYFFPFDIQQLNENLAPLVTSFTKATSEFHSFSTPDALKGLKNDFENIIKIIAEVLQTLINSDNSDMERTVIQVFSALKKCCRAHEILFERRRVSMDINRYFLEPPVHNKLKYLDPENPSANTGLFHISTESDPYARGMLSIYVPELYDGTEAWPLVVALHGGFGHGRDFMWTWVREARSRRFILAAPSSISTTWSILNPEIDGANLSSMLDYINNKWNFDMTRVLLTGFSDGGTFALMNALSENTPFTAFAPIACALPPLDIRRATGKRIYWVHGQLDWMFSIMRTQASYDALKKAGAGVTLKVIEDLSHTYPREENDSILRWFDSGFELL